MSYSDFVNTLANGFSLFYNSLVSIANVLIHNYLVITILGVGIFISLMYLFLNDILTIPFISKKIKADLDNVRGDK